ncbi:MAG TPA: Na+/H+ antiporter NhaC family protein, partial [Pseudonocardia sp.]|nr:Na+/H+ antiporter NhaC family protein [Pseudonocardia sp.]
MSEQTPPTKTAPEDRANAYEVQQSRSQRIATTVIAVVGLAACAVGGFGAEAPTLWGLAPIVLYAVLALLGMDILIVTVVSLVGGVLIAGQTPAEFGSLLGESVGDFVTTIGLIIMLGAGVGEVLRVTGVAHTIVQSVMRIAGERNLRAVQLGIMLSCLVLVTSLGTLAGALAISAPILLPIAARVGFTRSATAAMMFVGGCAGLALAPFAGSNVAVMQAAEVGYLTYLQYGAAPIAVLSIIMAMLIVPWIQRRTATTGDFYTDTDLESGETHVPASAGRATAVFLVLLVATVVYATITKAGTSFPLLALPLLGIATGVAGRLSATDIASHIYRGASRLISIFLLFWMLAAMFHVIDELKPFDVILEQFGPQLQNASGLGFAITIALLGWVGVPGATAAQVVLLDEVFGGVASTVGIGAGAWVIVLLWASKADTYGPFPNAN